MGPTHPNQPVRVSLSRHQLDVGTFTFRIGMAVQYNQNYVCVEFQQGGSAPLGWSLANMRTCGTQIRRICWFFSPVGKGLTEGVCTFPQSFALNKHTSYTHTCFGSDFPRITIAICKMCHFALPQGGFWPSPTHVWTFDTGIWRSFPSNFQHNRAPNY